MLSESENNRVVHPAPINQASMLEDVNKRQHLDTEEEQARAQSQSQWQVISNAIFQTTIQVGSLCVCSLDPNVCFCFSQEQTSGKEKDAGKKGRSRR